MKRLLPTRRTLLLCYEALAVIFAVTFQYRPRTNPARLSSWVTLLWAGAGMVTALLVFD